MHYFGVILLTLLGILAIGKGSDWFTESLIPVARRLSVTHISVALILVAGAMSLPEILVAVYGALKHYPDISLGVVLGSIICNIGLMIGFSSMLRDLKVPVRTILRDGVFSIVVPILILAISLHGRISRTDGLAFFLLFIPYVINVFLQEKLVPRENKEEDLKELEIKLSLLGFNFGKLKPGWLSFFLGLLLLFGGTQIFTDQLIAVVRELHWSAVLVGLTIGTIGPSLPNIISAYKATKKGLEEVAIPETLGSNIFTMLVTLGILAMISPVLIEQRWVYYDIPALILMSLLLFAMMVAKKGITKRGGLLLLSLYLLILAGQIIFLR